MTFCVLAVLLLGGCRGFGARTLSHDRFDYTEAIAASWKQQMLINMVKLRYGDTPVFLDVVSVINQYSIEAQMDVRGTWVDPVASIGDSASVGGAARYTDKPTITYAPLSGERFARSLMKPIPPTAVLSLIQAGYPVDGVFRVCTHSINGIRNRYGGSARSRPADPDFYPLLARMRKVQDSGALGLRVRKTADEMEGTLLTLRGSKSDPALEGDAEYIRRTLRLSPTAEEFNVAYGSVAKDDREVAILTRSMLEIIIDLASYIDVPEEHVRRRSVGPTMPPETTPAGEAVPALINIRSSPGKPPDSFIAVPYRGHWYWIDDGDLRSKTLFTFLMFVFSLTEIERSDAAPIVTIPAG